MKSFITTLASALFAIALTALGAVPALAATTAVSASVGIDVNAGTSVSGSASTTVKANAVASAQARATAEINRRITNLNSLSARIGQMKKVSASDMTSLNATISAQISALQALSIKISADTDITTLKADVQSITKSYRIYMLVIPQGRITAAADRVLDVAGLMQQLSTKLSARISAAASAGVDVTALTADETDLNAKVADSTVQANAAITEVSALQPDNGVASVEASNTAALKDAESKVKVGQQDLLAARTDAANIIAGVKGHSSVTASSTTSVTP